MMEHAYLMLNACYIIIPVLLQGCICPSGATSSWFKYSNMNYCTRTRSQTFDDAKHECAGLLPSSTLADFGSSPDTFAHKLMARCGNLRFNDDRAYWIESQNGHISSKCRTVLKTGENITVATTSCLNSAYPLCESPYPTTVTSDDNDTSDVTPTTVISRVDSPTVPINSRCTGTTGWYRVQQHSYCIVNDRYNYSDATLVCESVNSSFADLYPVKDNLRWAMMHFGQGNTTSNIWIKYTGPNCSNSQYKCMLKVNGTTDYTFVPEHVTSKLRVFCERIIQTSNTQATSTKLISSSVLTTPRTSTTSSKVSTSAVMSLKASTTFSKLFTSEVMTPVASSTSSEVSTYAVTTARASSTTSSKSSTYAVTHPIDSTTSSKQFTSAVTTPMASKISFKLSISAVTPPSASTTSSKLSISAVWTPRATITSSILSTSALTPPIASTTSIKLSTSDVVTLVASSSAIKLLASTITTPMASIGSNTLSITATSTSWTSKTSSKLSTSAVTTPVALATSTTLLSPVVANYWTSRTSRKVSSSIITTSIALVSAGTATTVQNQSSTTAVNTPTTPVMSAYSLSPIVTKRASESSSLPSNPDTTQGPSWIQIKQEKYYSNYEKQNHNAAREFCERTLDASLVYFRSPLLYFRIMEQLHLKDISFWMAAHSMNDRLEDKCLVYRRDIRTLSLSLCTRKLSSVCSRSIYDKNALETAIENPAFQKMLKEMTVNKSETSKNKRKLASMNNDDRRTAKAAGGLSVVLLCFVVLLLVIMDLSKLRWFCNCVGINNKSLPE